MYKLILSNTSQNIKNNYIVSGNIREYLKLMKENFIEEYTCNFLIAKEVANFYNKNEKISTINVGMITLLISNDGINEVKYTKGGKQGLLFINCDKFQILDGRFRTEMMKYLNERFWNSRIMIRMCFLTDDEATELLMSY